MQRILFTYKEPLTKAPCVRWFKNLVNGRKFIRSLAADVTYSVTINEDYEFRGSYFVLDDYFIEMQRCGRIEIEGEVYDQDI